MRVSIDRSVKKVLNLLYDGCKEEIKLCPEEESTLVDPEL